MRAFTLTMFVILIVLSGTVTVYGYNQFVEAAAINNLEVSLYDIKLVAFGLRSCDLLLELKIHNPNRVAASIGKLLIIFITMVPNYTFSGMGQFLPRGSILIPL